MPRRPRVVVIGAGPAGLLAARVLAEHVDEVLVLDRDHLPSEPVPRDGVPQDRHWSCLDLTGTRAFEHLMPGWRAEAVAAGGRRELGGMVIGRPLLESLVRRRVSALDPVHVMAHTSVLDLVHDPGSRRVTGVVATDVDRGTTSTLLADLVVDASGQGTRTPAWLTRRGIEVAEERVGVNATYVTRRFVREPSACQPSLARHVEPAGAEEDWQRAAVVASLGDRWLVTLAGSHGRRPPTDLPGFAAYAGQVCGPLSALLAGRPAIGEASVHRMPSTVTRRILPSGGALEGLVVVGDAWRSEDPLSRGGLTAAACAATALAEVAAVTDVRELGGAWLARTNRC